VVESRMGQSGWLEQSGRVVEIEPGTEVEVRTRFTGEWAVGFSVVAVVGEDMTVRRHRDGAVLPALFKAGEVRASEAGGISPS
jgi:hypothetical protein